MDFHSTRMGQQYYTKDFPQLANHVPRIASALEKIAVELEKLNEGKEGMQSTHLKQKGVNNPYTLEQIADEIAPFEPTFARLLREYI